jgi:hypothetical protein
MKTKLVNRAVENDFTPFRDAQILSVFNAFSPRPLSGFMDRYAMERRTQDLLDMRGLMIHHQNNGGSLQQIDGVFIYRAESHPSNVQALGHVHRDSNRIIRLLIDHNPKRQRSAVRFAQYRDGMTVYEYRMACRAAQGGDAYQVAENDIDFDVKKGYIRIEIDADQELAEHAAKTILGRDE